MGLGHGNRWVEWEDFSFLNRGLTLYNMRNFTSVTLRVFRSPAIFSTYASSPQQKSFVLDEQKREGMKMFEFAQLCLVECTRYCTYLNHSYFAGWGRWRGEGEEWGWGWKGEGEEVRVCYAKTVLLITSVFLQGTTSLSKILWKTIFQKKPLSPSYSLETKIEYLI